MPSGIYIRTDEALKNMSNATKGENNPMYGKHHTYKAKKKMSIFHIDKCFSDEHKKNISISREGKHHSKKTKQKLSNANKGEKHYMYGKHRTKETKQKIRLSTIKRIEENKLNGNQLIPNYNPKACKIIYEYGKKNGYSFQHAENGGEYHIKELGYWVDGYDRDKNVVIEIDKRRHFDRNGNLRKKDIVRQNEIEQYLNCKFIRINI